jgi:hypothetical protein
MMRAFQEQRLGEPCAAGFIEKWQAALKVDGVLVSEMLGLVQKLNLRS